MDDTTQVGPSLERRRNAVVTTAMADALAVRRARAADPAVVPWDDVVEAAVTTAADLAGRSGHRPDHHRYLAAFFGSMAQAPSAAEAAARPAPRRQKSAARRKAAVDLGIRLARRVDDPASTLTPTVDGLGSAVDAARRLAMAGRETEAWCVLAGFTSSIGDRIAEAQLRAAPIATERAALAHDEFVLRHSEPQSVGHSRGDALGL